MWRIYGPSPISKNNFFPINHQVDAGTQLIISPRTGRKKPAVAKCVRFLGGTQMYNSSFKRSWVGYNMTTMQLKLKISEINVEQFYYRAVGNWCRLPYLGLKQKKMSKSIIGLVPVHFDFHQGKQFKNSISSKNTLNTIPCNFQIVRMSDCFILVGVSFKY